VTVTDQEINNRVQQIINEAGGQAKFDEYLTRNELTLPDLCAQIRANVFGELVMGRVTQNLPTRVEQVNVAHILFANKEDAATALAQLKGGADFAAVAKQMSQDEVTRDNGGVIGWIPRNVMAPEFEQAAFALEPGQVSEVVVTQLGFHIIKTLERDPARALSPELLQNQRQGAFIAWLEEQRETARIERLVTP
jgi:parvulin-like peptidyl-prolyl isomerase